jgi:farnesyl-diphosphate farnesyltransferase
LEQRLQALNAFRVRIVGGSSSPLKLETMISQQKSTAERILLQECEISLGMLDSFDEGSLGLVRKVLATIISGQELDLKRFAGAAENKVVALRTDEELHDYTYRVAGCVGEFWTKICRAYVFPKAKLDDQTVLEESVRFGKGLQLVNILRDLPLDLRLGRCYLPEEELGRHGLEPQDLLDPINEPRLRPLYDQYLNRAQEHLVAGWNYTNALPWRRMRVRVACAWPVLIGLQTIQRLRKEHVLDPQNRIKITRQEVRSWIIRSILYYPLPRRWRMLVEEATGN